MNKKIEFKYGVFTTLPHRCPIDEDKARMCTDTTELLAIIYPSVEYIIWKNNSVSLTMRSDSITNELYYLNQYLGEIVKLQGRLIGEVTRAAKELAEISASYPCVDLQKVFRDFLRTPKEEKSDDKDS